MSEFNAIQVSAPDLPPAPAALAPASMPAETYVFSNNAPRWKYVRLAFAGVGLCMAALALAMLALCVQPAVLPELALKVSPGLPPRSAVAAQQPIRQSPNRLVVARLHLPRRRHGLRSWQRRFRGVRTL